MGLSRDNWPAQISEPYALVLPIHFKVGASNAITYVGPNHGYTAERTATGTYVVTIAQPFLSASCGGACLDKTSWASEPALTPEVRYAGQSASAGTVTFKVANQGVAEQQADMPQDGGICATLYLYTSIVAS